MAKIVEAQAIISAKDNTGGAFASVAKKLADVSKSGKLVNDAMSGMGKQISLMQDKLSKIQNFNGLRSGLADARTKFRSAQADVERLGKAISAAGTPTRDMARQMTAAQRAVSSASAAYRQQAAAVIAAKNAMQGAGVPVSAMAREQARLKARIDGANASLARQTQITRTVEREAARSGGRGGSMQHVGGGGHGAAIVVGGHAAVGLAHRAVDASTDLANAINQARMSGMSEEQIGQATSKAAELATEFPSVGRGSIVRMIQSQTAVTGDIHHAMDAIRDNVRLRAIAQMKDPAANLDAGFEALNKGMELFNKTGDPVRHHAAMNSIAKATNFFGHTLNLEDWYQMAITSKGAAQNLNPDFMFNTLPAIASEMRGGAAGEAVYSFNRAVVGGKMSHSAIKTLDDLGLVDPTKVDKTSTGAIKGIRPEGVIGWREAQSDPRAWVKNTLLPAFDKKGITDPERRDAILTSMFSSGRALQLVKTLINQDARIEKDRAGIGRAEDLDAADRNKTRDAGTAIAGLNTSFTDLIGTLSGPMVEKGIPALNALSASMNAVANWGKENPVQGSAVMTGAVAGTGFAVTKGTQWFLGSVGRALGFGGGAEAGAGAAGASAATAEAGGGILSGIAAGAARLSGVVGSFYAAHKALEAHSPTNATNWSSRWDPELQGVYERSYRAQKEFRQGADMEGARGRAMARRDDTASQITATLEGKADVNVKVELEPTPDFWAKVKSLTTQSSGHLNANGPGSNGTSRIATEAPVHNIGRGDR